MRKTEEIKKEKMIRKRNETNKDDKKEVIIIHEIKTKYERSNYKNTLYQY